MKMTTEKMNLTSLEHFVLIKIGKAYKFFLNFFRESNLIVFLIFKIPVRKKAQEINWDITTLVLKGAIDKHIQNNEKKILDMGCGHIAILAQYIKKNYKLSDVTGVDIYQNFIKNAKLNVKRNNLNIKILKSNLYQNIKDKYDYIIFNPPYVQRQKMKMKYQKIRFSGKDGTYMTRRFLSESKKYLKRNGKILLGINCFYIPLNKIRDIIKKYNYKIEDIVTSRFNTSKVFVLSKVRKQDENN